MNALKFCFCLILFVLVACGGGSDGGGGDTGGSSGGSGGGSYDDTSDDPAELDLSAMQANFPSIQSELFTPTCAVSGCHNGASAPEGLQLTAGNSYALLVGIASGQMPSMNRVEPGDAENSYIIWKLEGRSGIQGQRMPRGGPYLTAAQIDIIKQWINDGASETAMGNDAAAALKVNTVSPALNAQLVSSPNEIVIGFNDEIDASSVDASAFSLTSSGGDGLFDNGNERQLAFTTRTIAVGNTKTVVLMPQAELEADIYQITVHSTLGRTVKSLQAKSLARPFLSYFYIN